MTGTEAQAIGQQPMIEWRERNARLSKVDERELEAVSGLATVGVCWQRQTAKGKLQWKWAIFYFHAGAMPVSGFDTDLDTAKKQLEEAWAKILTHLGLCPVSLAAPTPPHPYEPDDGEGPGLEWPLDAAQGDPTDTIKDVVAIARGEKHANGAALRPAERNLAELGVRRVFAAGYRIVGPEDDGRGR